MKNFLRRVVDTAVINDSLMIASWHHKDSKLVQGIMLILQSQCIVSVYSLSRTVLCLFIFVGLSDFTFFCQLSLKPQELLGIGKSVCCRAVRLRELLPLVDGQENYGGCLLMGKLHWQLLWEAKYMYSNWNSLLISNVITWKKRKRNVEYTVYNFTAKCQ